MHLRVLDARHGVADGAFPVAPTRGALMAEVGRASGYRVQTREGNMLGRVAWLRHDGSDDQIDALMVRPPSWRGLFSTRDQSIPSERIESVAHDHRLVIVSSLVRETTEP